jgi:hypothetical protein
VGLGSLPRLGGVKQGLSEALDPEALLASEFDSFFIPSENFGARCKENGDF